MEEVETVRNEFEAGEDAIGDDFYEKIEAPKFVDLAAPNSHHEPVDDRFWFCARVGCDRRHEQDMDSEAIYKDFVLRVMAARSPSVRLQKALRRKNPSTPAKSPRTAPPKPTRSRASKLAMISSFPQKALDYGIKSKKDATPIVKTAQPSSKSKAMTAASMSKDKSLKSFASRSVRNTKACVIEPQDGAVVAKALVFHSPKKMVKLKRSVELKAICRGMKKLDLKNSDRSGKQLRVREVKSRVYGSSRPQKSKDTEVEPEKSLKKPRRGTEVKSSSKSSKVGASKPQLSETKSTSEKVARNGAGHQNRREDEENLKTYAGNILERVPKVSEEEVSGGDEPQRVKRNNGGGICDKAVPSVIENVDARVAKQDPVEGAQPKENSAVLMEDLRNSDDRVHEGSEAEDDNKENASASETNRKLNFASKHLVENKASGYHGAMITPQKKMKKKDVKITNDRITTLPKCATEPPAKYRKPKLTNPKPFRLRTDERGILKEANTEKRLQPSIRDNSNLKSNHPNIGLESTSQKNPKRQTCRKTSVKDDSIPDNTIKKTTSLSAKRFVSDQKKKASAALKPIATTLGTCPTERKAGSSHITTPCKRIIA